MATPLAYVFKDWELLVSKGRGEEAVHRIEDYTKVEKIACGYGKDVDVWRYAKRGPNATARPFMLIGVQCRVRGMSGRSPLKQQCTCSCLHIGIHSSRTAISSSLPSFN